MEGPAGVGCWRRLPERISNHFDRVRDLLAEETSDSDA